MSEYKCPNHGSEYGAVAYNFVTRESFCGRCGEKLEKEEEAET